MMISNHMDENAILGIIYAYSSSKIHLASPRVIFLLSCNCFPNHTPIHALTNTKLIGTTAVNNLKYRSVLTAEL